MAGTKTYSTSSLDRRPLRNGAPAGVTISEIERRVAEIFPRASLDERRRLAMLFAILKEGSSLQKLQRFTSYPMELIRESVERLRSAGLIFTGTLSTQYVLDQAPGSESLIEEITGQRIVHKPAAPRAPAGYDWQRHLKAPPVALDALCAADGKEESMTTTNNGGADAESLTCPKSELCDKPAGHTGRCKGPSQPRAKTETAKASRSKPAQNGRLEIMAALDGLSEGRYRITYEDETRQLTLEGIGREAFVAALKAAEAVIGS